MYVLPLVLVLFIRASICMASVAARMSAVEAWCPRYHQVGGGRDGHEPDIYDPSGPIKVGATWYVFADGGSTHWESADLLRWKKVTPGWFSGLTGSITLTPSGYHAIYVGKAGTGGSGMVRRTAVGNNLSEWSAAELINHSGVAGGMDPAEAFLLNGSWRLPVLAGGGRLSLMRATDDTLGSFDSAMLVLNETTIPGQFDSTTATWRAGVQQITGGLHFECPDLFQIGKRSVVFASLSTGAPSNSLWWVGDINATSGHVRPDGGCAPLPCASHPGHTFCPTNSTKGQCEGPPVTRCPPGKCPPPPSPATFVTLQAKQQGPLGMASRGALDYGNWYSAKHGSDGRPTNSSRNVVFGVAGLMLNSGHLKAPAWMQRCQRYHTIPRDVTVDEKTGLLEILPIPEIATLRLDQPRKLTGLSLIGSQIEVKISCSNIHSEAIGAFGIDVLGTASMNETTRLGVNLTVASASSPPTAFVDTSLTTARHSSYIDGENSTSYHNPGTNSVPLWQLYRSTTINITVLVDASSYITALRPFGGTGGMVEAFFGNQLPITTLVQPSLHSDGSNGPDSRYVRPFNSVEGVQCDSWASKLASL